MPLSSASRPGAALLAAVLALSGCSSVRTNAGQGISVYTQGAAVPAVKEAGEKEAYEKGVRAFEDIPVAEVLRRLEKGWSGTLFFGFVDCPWCRAALPAIIKAADRTGQDVCYVRVRDGEGKLLYTEAQRRQLAGAIGGYMKKNDREGGKLWLYVPLVVSVRDGKAVKGHTGTLEGHDPSRARLSRKQEEKLTDILVETMRPYPAAAD